MTVHEINMAEHSVQLLNVSLYLPGSRSPAGINDRRFIFKFTSHEQALSHGSNRAAVFTTNVNLFIYQQASNGLTRVTILHTSLGRINRKTRTGNKLLKFGSRLPFVGLSGDLA